MSKAATRSRGIGCVAVIALASPGVLSASAASGAVAIATAGASRHVGVLSRPRTDRGIVQSVSASALVLKVLDGSTLVARVDAKTRVFVNGKRASILDVERGFVAVVTYEPGKRGEKAKAAREVQAFGTPRPKAKGSGKGKPKERPPGNEWREVWAFAQQHEQGARLDLGVVPSLTPGAIVLG